MLWAYSCDQLNIHLNGSLEHAGFFLVREDSGALLPAVMGAHV